MQCHGSRRSHELQECAREEFWDVISTLTQDLTKARNQLARLMKMAKPGGARLFGGDCGRSPLQPIRNFTPCGGSQIRNCHRLPPPGRFGCGKDYPHYKSPSPERRRPPCRPVTVCGANSFRHSQQRAPSFGCGRSPQRPSWFFEQPQERVHYSCEKEYSRAPEAPYSCERQEKCGRSRPRDSNCVQICINPDPPAARRRCNRTPNPCRGGSGPARLQGGGRAGRDCIATQFATLLQDVTCQLRERRLAAAAEGRF